MSPELAALIRDAEHVSGQDYEESLCLREETSMSEANASSRHRSSNGEAAQDPDADVRRSRRKHRGSDAEDAHEQHQSERNDTRALIVAASAQAKRHKNISERSKELMMRAKHSTRQYSGDATAARYNQKTDPPLRHTKHRGSARPAYSSGRAYSGRRSVVSHDTDEFDDTGLSFVPTPTSAPRIQLPSNAAGKKAMKTCAIFSFWDLPQNFHRTGCGAILGKEHYGEFHISCSLRLLRMFISTTVNVWSSAG